MEDVKLITIFHLAFSLFFSLFLYKTIKMRKISIILFILFFTSCAGIRVNYDYDKATDFSNYTTYNYYPDMETGLSPFDTKRLLLAVDNTMQTKGFKLSEEPDFYINIKSKTFRGPQNSNASVGVGGGGGAIGGGLSIGIPVGKPEIEREISFDFVDSKKDRLFWNAISESSLKENATPEAKEQKLLQIVIKVLAKYPPENK